MRNSKTKDSTTRFLIYSFIGLLIFSIIIFSLLGICNLLGGIAAPILFIVGGGQNKKAAAK